MESRRPTSEHRPPPRRALAACALAAALALLPSCGKERRAEYERERDALAATAADLQAAQLALLLPKSVPREVPAGHFTILVHSESVQDLHERDEAYVDLKEQNIEDLRKDVEAMAHLLALKAETERVRALPWRRP
jgi:hypothetical protein